MALASKELLDILAEKANCIYLSDLLQTEFKRRILFPLHEMEPYDFSLKDWNDAVKYLVQEDYNFETAEQAREFLINYVGDL